MVLGCRRGQCSTLRVLASCWNQSRIFPTGGSSLGTLSPGHAQFRISFSSPSPTFTLPHRSTVPTPFAGYSFHVVEALIVFANEIIVCFLFPIHASLHRIYHLFTTLIHIGV